MKKSIAIEPQMVIQCGKAGKIQKARIRNNGWTVRKRASFLDHLAATCNVDFSARSAGVDPSNAHRLRRREPEFATLWRHALEAGYDRLQEMLIQRASGITEMPIGETPVPDIAKMDTDLAMRLIEHNRRSVITGTRRDGGKPQRATEEQTDAAIVKKLRVLAKRAGYQVP